MSNRHSSRKTPFVCPWWGGYFIDNRFRRWIHNPDKILDTYVQTGSTVLDFGCGMGFFTIAMARRVGERGRVIAVDLQQKMLDVLDRRAQKAGVTRRIKTHRCPAHGLDWKQPVDFVLAFYSAHEVPDPRRLLNDIHECLREDGHLVVVEPVGHVTEAAFQAMIATAEDIGFTLVDRPRICLSRAADLVKVARS